MSDIRQGGKPETFPDEKAGGESVALSKTSIFGWSEEIVIGDLRDPAIPIEDWHIVADPDRV